MAADSVAPAIVERHVYLDSDLGRPECIDAGRFRIGIHSARRPGKAGANEDGALCLGLSDGSLVVAVADGMGGHAAGEQAAATALRAIEDGVRDALAQGRGLRAGVVDGIDAAHAAVGTSVGASLRLAALEGLCFFAWTHVVPHATYDPNAPGRTGKQSEQLSAFVKEASFEREAGGVPARIAAECASVAASSPRPLLD